MAGQAPKVAQRVIPRDVTGTVNARAAKSPPLDRQPSMFMRNSNFTALILLTAMAPALSAAQAFGQALSGQNLSRESLPGDFVYLRDLDPSVVQDIRYAGVNNFMGRPIAGYSAGECVVKRAVGLALQKVQRELAPQKLSLKMLDCYRPARAVADMLAWSQNGQETAAERRYNPAFSKQELFRLGYIANHSQHSTGAAVDLTLVDRSADNSAAFDPARTYADCTAPAAARAPDASVDMGTGYDCSDPKGHTASASITPSQRRWRNLLVTAMGRQGFVNYSKEWWHFSMPGAGGPAYDFPIKPHHD
jgi:zinc D-Ala-D-Ala dipeptidase